MLLGDMKTELRKKIGNPSITDVSDTDLVSLLNKATNEISDKFRFHNLRDRSLFDTTADTDKYEIPTNSFTVLSVTVLADDTLPQNSKLHRRDSAWADENADDQTTGRPTDYIRYKNYIQLWPIPDAVYSVQVFGKIVPTPLSSDSDSPSLPDAWHDGIIKKARYIFWDDQGEMQKAQFANNSWLQWLQDKPNEMEDEEFYDGDYQGVKILGLGDKPSNTASYRRAYFEVTD